MDNERYWLRINPRRKLLIFVILMLVTLALMMALQVIGAPLQTETAPAGIISYEFAGDLSAARGMIRSWGSLGQVYAGLSLGLDYLFLTAYSVTIALGCCIVARRVHPRFRFLIRLGSLLAWGQFLAAALDALENYALIRVLLGSENAIWPQVAYWCAGPKFLIVLLGILYVLLGVLFTIAPGNRAEGSPAS